MKNRLFNPQLVSLNQPVNNWEEAIEVSCEKLIENKYITDKYCQSIINVVNEVGAYFILLDNFALPHCDDFNAVNKSGISLTTLLRPVIFPNGKSVQVVCTLAAADKYEHLSLLQELAIVLQKPKIIEQLSAIDNYLQLEQILEEK